MAPSPEASRLDVLRDLWASAGLGDIEMMVIAVELPYVDIGEIWSTILGGPSACETLAAMSEQERSEFRELLRGRLQPYGSDPITLSARAHATRGKVSRS